MSLNLPNLVSSVGSMGNFSSTAKIILRTRRNLNLDLSRHCRPVITWAGASARLVRGMIFAVLRKFPSDATHTGYQITWFNMWTTIARWNCINGKQRPKAKCMEMIIQSTDCRVQRSKLTYKTIQNWYIKHAKLLDQYITTRPFHTHHCRFDHHHTDFLHTDYSLSCLYAY